MDAGRDGARHAAELIAWAARNAVPIRTVQPESGLDDLRPLQALVGDTLVVAVGESTHTLSEQLRFKHRLLEFLACEMGFTVLALEESMACCARVDAYVRGGSGDPGALVDGFGLHTIWDTEEMVDLVRWIRRHNSTVPDERQIRFYGLDIGYPGAGVRDALTLLGQAAPAAELGLDLFSDDDWAVSARRYEGLSEADREAVGTGLAELVAALDARRGAASADDTRRRLDHGHRLAVVAARAHEMFCCIAAGAWRDAIDLRDRAMADNLLWLVREAEPGRRALLWAHNGHIARAERLVPDARWQGPITPMGLHLHRALGDKLLVVGCTSHSNRFHGTIANHGSIGCLDGCFWGRIAQKTVS